MCKRHIHDIHVQIFEAVNMSYLCTYLKDIPMIYTYLKDIPKIYNYLKDMPSIHT
jgi:hypothetical protein